MSSPIDDPNIFVTYWDQIYVDQSAYTSLFLLFWLLYGAFTLVLMIVLFFCYSFMKRYQTTIFRLIQADLILNIICYLNTWPALRFFVCPFGVDILKWIAHNSPEFLKWSFHFQHFFFHIQFFSVLAAILYRLGILYNVEIAKKWYSWTAYYVVTLTACLFLVVVVMERQFEFSITEEYGLISMHNNKIGETNLFINFYCGCVYFLILAGTGIWMVVMCRWHAGELLAEKQTVFKLLTGIAISTAVIFVGNFSYLAYNVLCKGFPGLKIGFFFENNLIILPFLSDLMTLSLPYILLAFDRRTRELMPKCRGNSVHPSHLPQV